MSKVFISHSSRDSDRAKEMITWLNENGFADVFLDFDKESGIAVGDNWERRLYAEIERCHAVIILITRNWHESKWCWSEFTQARALGKVIFPLIVEPTIDGFVSADIQTIDLVNDRIAGLKQLLQRLTEVALGAQGGFRWDSIRPPFPGLLSFEEEDAAIYFGRSDETRKFIERLHARRTQGGAPLLALLGASGSGKSSLLRAGVIPRLKRLPQAWTVIPPFRPQRRAVDELATSLALALGDAKSWRTVRDRLWSESVDYVFGDLSRDLRMAAGAHEARILIPIDQAEELFSVTDASETRRFFELLSSALDSQLPYLAVMAIRSDYLGLLQSVKELSVDFEQFSLRPLDSTKIPSIITGPAKVAGIQVDDELVRQAAQDAETDDALPLLAFTLRELYDHYGQDRHLSIADYNALGDPNQHLNPLENAVRKAADLVIDEVRPTVEELNALREAFIPALVRIDEDGDYARRSAPLETLPNLARPLIDRFVNARLLVIRFEGDHRLVEVAHEALLRKWPLLRAWLEETREFLIGKKRLELDLHEWQLAAPDRKADALLTGLKLERARAWLVNYPRQLLQQERVFIEESIAREAEERHRRSAEKEFADRQLILQSGVLADYAQTQSQAGNHAAAILLALEGLPDESEGIIRPLVGRAQEALQAALDEHRERTILNGHFSNYGIPKFTPDGTRLMTWEPSGPIRLWDVETGQVLVTATSKHETSGKYDIRVDGSRLVTWFDKETTADLWNVQSGELIARLDGNMNTLSDVKFASNAMHVVTVSEDQHLQIWDSRTGEHLGSVLLPYSVYRLQLIPNSDRMLCHCHSRNGLILSDTNSGQVVKHIPYSGDSRYGIAVSQNGAWIVTTKENIATIWDVATGTRVSELQGHRDRINAVCFDPVNGRIATASDDRFVRVWDPRTGDLVWRSNQHDHKVQHVVFSFDSSKVLSAAGETQWEDSRGNGIYVWNATSGEVIAELHADDDQTIAPFFDDIFTFFNQDVTRVVTFNKSALDRNRRIQVLWDVTRGQPIRQFDMAELFLEQFSPNSGLLIGVANDRSVRVVNPDNGKEVMVLRGHRQLHSDVDASGNAVLSADGHYLATWIWDNTVRIWDMRSTATCQFLRYITGNLEDVRYVLDREDKLALAHLEDSHRRRYALVLIDLEHEAIVTEKWSEEQLRPTYTVDNRWVVVRDGLTSLQLCNTNSLVPQWKYGPCEASIRHVSFYDDETKLVLFLENNTIHIIDAASGGCLTNYGPTYGDGRELSGINEWGVTTTIDKENHLFVWNLYQRSLVAEFTLPERPKRVIAVGTYHVVTMCDDRKAALWDTRSGKLVFEMVGYEDAKSETQQIVTYEKDNLVLRSMHDGSEIDSRAIPHVVRAMFVANTGRILILQDLANENVAVFTLWNTHSGESKVLLRGSRSYYQIDQLDERMIRIRGESEWAWDSLTGVPEQVQTSGTHHSRSKDVRKRFISSNDRTIAATILEIVTKPDGLQDLMNRAKRAIPRGLTPQERKSFHLDVVPPRWYINMGKWPYNTPEWVAWQQARDKGENPAMPEYRDN